MAAAKGFWQTTDEATVVRLVEDWARQGIPEAAIIRRLGVSPSSFRRWKRQKPALRAALACREESAAAKDSWLALSMPEKLGELRARAEAGAGEPALIDWLGISRSTYYRWKQRYPEFRAAVSAGRRRPGWEALALPDRLPLVREWAAAGVAYEDIARRLGVSPATLNSWQHEHPELRTALDRHGKAAGSRRIWARKDMPAKLVAVEGWARQGASDEEIAGMLGVSRGTLRRWKREQPEFAAALGKGRQVADGEILASAFRQATGYTYVEEQVHRVKGELQVVRVVKFAKPNASLTQFFLRHHLPERYGDPAAQPEKEPYMFEVELEKLLKGEDESEPGGAA